MLLNSCVVSFPEDNYANYSWKQGSVCRDPRAIDPSAAMRQQRGVGMGRRREDPGLLTRAVDKVFRFVRFAEFEIFFVLFFIIAFILFKNLVSAPTMSQPQYNQMFVKKPDLDDAWP
ncbi:hypothetical protein PR202_gb02586 [Eleusine coracana subsp. coracana]|uniref:Uncharacterized protein n=1 Tax=Eleusine coracana subsp. coracana TaxID=191504 RepID=A0AAV5DYV8_ELECO|nr:hypothetical protein PR202_gb02586 [Eleusine coracana subsp. coracana]